MKLKRAMIIFFILLIFVALLVLLVRTYFGVRDAKEYINAVVGSTNTLLEEVNDVNNLLNQFGYQSEGESVEGLEEELQMAKSKGNDARSTLESLVIPYGADEINDEYLKYLDSYDDTMLAFEQIIISAKALESREEFEKKQDQYISNYTELQTISESVEVKLNDYVENYAKYDFNRVINEIKSIF